MHRHTDPVADPFQKILVGCFAFLIAGCASVPVTPVAPAKKFSSDRTVERRTVAYKPSLDLTLEDRILGLNPERISDQDVRAVLAQGPTPRIILLHGSVYPAYLVMSSFANFLDRMGYPDVKLRDPNDGSYSQSPYGSSDRIAGEIAWYYEHDGVRPLMIGHSQGGMQAVKVLYKLAGDYTTSVPVWNPVIDKPEDRTTIIDPLTGHERPVVGLSVAYASALGAGGAAFVLPNQWDMFNRLRTIPNTVDEFTGFAINGDFVAFSFPGMSDSSQYRRANAAKVRNVVLPVTYNHGLVPVTHQLAADAQARDWINAYVPTDAEEHTPPGGLSGYNILWAADVWYSIKKHWCLEAQRLVRATQAARDTGIRTSLAQPLRPGSVR